MARRERSRGRASDDVPPRAGLQNGSPALPRSHARARPPAGPRDPPSLTAPVRHTCARGEELLENPWTQNAGAAREPLADLFEFARIGPRRDAGLTGRKTVVDTYGGFARQGGGALSGKDPAHVDRFGAYAARYIARHVVAAGLARRCEVQLGYGIGEQRPLAVSVETFGSGAVPDEQIERALDDAVDLRATAIVEAFGLRTLPQRRVGEFYRALAAYGHFGRTDLDPPWEREDLAPKLRRATGRHG